jgi:hypothetical protein
MTDAPDDTNDEADATSDETGDVPEETIDEAERLSRLAREAVDENEAAAYRQRRDELLADHDYTTRVREDERAVLVCYPSEWVDDSGTVHPDRIEDVDRGVERPLEGPGEADDWQVVEDHNRALADAVETEHGEPHGPTAHALADFAGNHYAKPIDDLTSEEIAEFREEYLPRNGWPSEAQQEALSLSIELVFEKIEESRST